MTWLSIGFFLAARELPQFDTTHGGVTRLLKVAEVERRTRGELRMVLDNAGLDPRGHPDFMRALSPRGSGVPLVELAGLQRSILRSVPRDMPADGWISSRFGERQLPGHIGPELHKGIDIAASEGTLVRAPSDGIVRFSGRYGGFGLYLSIVHGFGFVTKYAHNSKLLVKAGDYVTRGDPIAIIGSTGRASGIHLHYEVWVNDKPIDPTAFMPSLRLPDTNVLVMAPQLFHWNIDP